MTSEEKAFHDAVWQSASLDLQKHKGVFDATIRFYLNTWGAQLSKECIRQCIQLAGFVIQQQGGDRAKAQPLASPPAYSKYGTVIAEHELIERLKPWVEQIRQAGWGSVHPPSVSSECAATRTGQSAQEFLRTTGVYNVAADLGIAESAMTSLILSEAVSLVSAVEIHVRRFTVTLPNGETIQRPQGVIEVNFPTDIPVAEYRALGSATRKALGVSKTKGLKAADQQLLTCMQHVDTEGQVSHGTNVYWREVAKQWDAKTGERKDPDALRIRFHRLKKKLPTQ